jgi:hypothetical protein
MTEERDRSETALPVDSTGSAPDSSSKKPYTSPTLRSYGNIHEITLAIHFPTGGNDNSQQHPTKTHS